MEKSEPVILSLGGSLIYPNGGIDTNFLKSFNLFIRKEVAAGRRFFIICGGGALCRHYQDAGSEIMGHQLTHDDLDWLGIHVTRINAHLLRTIFRDIAHKQIIHHYEKKYLNIVKPVTIAAGWKPGWSTNYCAAALAKLYGAKMLIKMTNVKMVYDKDPSKFKDAKPIREWRWQNYLELVGNKWIPGMHLPLDPIAAKLASEIKLKVIILDGKNLKNMENVLEKRKFVGTIID